MPHGGRPGRRAFSNNRPSVFGWGESRRPARPSTGGSRARKPPGGDGHQTGWTPGPHWSPGGVGMSPKQHITPGARITRRLSLTAAAALSALAIAPGAANAGTYQMYNCHVAGHETANHGPWAQSTAFGSPGAAFMSGCHNAGSADGYEFGLYAPGALGANSRVNLTLSKDNSNITITGTKLWFKALTGIAPGAAITGGTLTAGGAQAGTKTVSVEGTDPDSGVRKLEVLLDDVLVAKVDYDRDWTKPLSE